MANSLKEFEEKLNSMASISQELANEDLPFVNRTDKAVVGVQTATSGWDSSPEASFKHLESRLLKLSEDFLENKLAINNTLLDHSNQLNGLKNDDKGPIVYYITGGGGGFDRGVCFLTLVTLGGLSFNIF